MKTEPEEEIGTRENYALCMQNEATVSAIFFRQFLFHSLLSSSRYETHDDSAKQKPLQAPMMLATTKRNTESPAIHFEFHQLVVVGNIREEL